MAEQQGKVKLPSDSLGEWQDRVKKLFLAHVFLCRGLTTLKIPDGWFERADWAVTMKE